MDLHIKLLQRFLKNPLSFKIGIFLAILHLGYIGYMIISIITLEGAQLAQWEMSWILPGHLDFPLSLILGKVLFYIIPEMDVDFLAILPLPMGSLLYFWLPVIFHGVIGTVWYFFLPNIIHRLSALQSEKKWDRIIYGFLWLSPLLCSFSDFALSGLPIRTSILFQGILLSLSFLVLLYFLAVGQRRWLLLYNLLFIFLGSWFLVCNTVIQYKIESLYGMLGYP